MIRQTSLMAHEDIQADGSAENQRMIILHFLKRYSDGLTRAEISNLLGISINAVCGRINELLKYGTCYEDGKRKNEITGKQNMILKAIMVNI